MLPGATRCVSPFPCDRRTGPKKRKTLPLGRVIKTPASKALRQESSASWAVCGGLHLRIHYRPRTMLAKNSMVPLLGRLPPALRDRDEPSGECGVSVASPRGVRLPCARRLASVRAGCLSDGRAGPSVLCGQLEGVYPPPARRGQCARQLLRSPSKQGSLVRRAAHKEIEP